MRISRAVLHHNVAMVVKVQDMVVSGDMEIVHLTIDQILTAVAMVDTAILLLPTLQAVL
jgi:hypothetical protein